MDNFDLEDFLRKLDAGSFDPALHDAIQKLTEPQLGQLAATLMKRELKRRANITATRDPKSRSSSEILF
jgi:hypothetical protein